MAPRARRPVLPRAVVAAVGLGRGERVLAFALDDHSGSYVIATTWALVVVPPPLATVAGGATPPGAAMPVRRPWHLVDAGVWAHEVATLSVSWVDRMRPSQWTFSQQRTLLPETLRERVQASVVLSIRLALGDRRTARVAIRQDLQTRELIPQTVLGRGTREDDRSVADQVAAAMADLRDQVGLPR